MAISLQKVAENDNTLVEAVKPEVANFATQTKRFAADQSGAC